MMKKWSSIVAEVLTTEEDGQPDEDQETGQTEMVASESEAICIRNIRTAKNISATP